MARPRQPWTCSHPIYAWTLTEVHQAVRYFLLAIFHASISIGTLDAWLGLGHENWATQMKSICCTYYPTSLKTLDWCIRTSSIAYSPISYSKFKPFWWNTYSPKGFLCILDHATTPLVLIIQNYEVTTTIKLSPFGLNVVISSINNSIALIIAFYLCNQVIFPFITTKRSQNITAADPQSWFPSWNI